jgi:hypothetical protein
MRLHRQWPEAELQRLKQQLSLEYPAVPGDVTALVLQMARVEVSPTEGPAALLAQARRLLGRSVLMQAIAEPSPHLAMAS